MYDYKEIDLDVPVVDGKLRGTLFLPEGLDIPPLIIASHGLSSTRSEFYPFAEQLCPLGFALYCFDFQGGSDASESGGDAMNMSVLTELHDLNAVVDAVRTWSTVDTSKVILLGASQGGLVSALCASQRPEDIAALILLFPALHIPELVRMEFPVRESIPDEYLVGDTIPVGRVFAEDIYDLDPYAEIPKYTGPTLLLHGDADTVVPLVFSQRAEKTYQDARLEIIPGGTHGFSGEAFDIALSEMKSFLAPFQSHAGADDK